MSVSNHNGPDAGRQLDSVEITQSGKQVRLSELGWADSACSFDDGETARIERLASLRELGMTGRAPRGGRFPHIPEWVWERIWREKKAVRAANDWIEKTLFREVSLGGLVVNELPASQVVCSWWHSQGAKNALGRVLRRMEKIAGHKSRFRPVFVTLTIQGIDSPPL